MTRTRLGRLLPAGLLLLALAALFGEIAWAGPQEAAGEGDYRALPFVSSRVIMWVVAELHLMFAAFVLAVPMFAIVIEFIGYKTGDKRFDELAHGLYAPAFRFLLVYGHAGRAAHVWPHGLLSGPDPVPGQDLQLDLSAICPAVFPGGLLPLRLLLRVGQVFAQGASCSWG